jgi:hypothetical protein
MSELPDLLCPNCTIGDLATDSGKWEVYRPKMARDEPRLDLRRFHCKGCKFMFWIRR